MGKSLQSIRRLYIPRYNQYSVKTKSKSYRHRSVGNSFKGNRNIFKWIIIGKSFVLGKEMPMKTQEAFRTLNRQSQKRTVPIIL